MQIEKINEKPKTRETMLFILLKSPASYDEDISGIKREEKAPITVDGKNIRGKTIPQRVPYELRASLPTIPFLFKPQGINRCSTVLRNERAYALTATGKAEEKTEGTFVSNNSLLLDGILQNMRVCFFANLCLLLSFTNRKIFKIRLDIPLMSPPKAIERHAKLVFEGKTSNKKKEITDIFIACSQKLTITFL